MNDVCKPSRLFLFIGVNSTVLLTRVFSLLLYFHLLQSPYYFSFPLIFLAAIVDDSINIVSPPKLAYNPFLLTSALNRKSDGDDGNGAMGGRDGSVGGEMPVL